MRDINVLLHRFDDLRRLDNKTFDEAAREIGVDPDDVTFSEDDNYRITITTVGFVVIALVLFINFLLGGTEDGFINAYESVYILFSDTWRFPVPGRWLCFIFVFVHYGRMFFGVNFIDLNTSFNIALHRNTEKARLRKTRRERILRFLLALTLFFFSIAVNRLPYEVFAYLILMQAFVIIFYNVLFWKEYYVWDEENFSNYYIFIGDMLFVFFAFTAFGAILFDGDITSTRYFASIALLLPLLVGAYITIVIGEFLAQYRRPLKKTLKILGDYFGLVEIRDLILAFIKPLSRRNIDVAEFAVDLWRITFRPEVQGGAPCIRDTGILVRNIANRISKGESASDVLQLNPRLEMEDILEALTYYARCTKADGGPEPEPYRVGRTSRGTVVLTMAVALLSYAAICAYIAYIVISAR